MLPNRRAGVVRVGGEWRGGYLLSGAVPKVLIVRRGRPDCESCAERWLGKNFGEGLMGADLWFLPTKVLANKAHGPKRTNQGQAQPARLKGSLASLASHAGHAASGVGRLAYLDVFVPWQVAVQWQWLGNYGKRRLVL